MTLSPSAPLPALFSGFIFRAMACRLWLLISIRVHQMRNTIFPLRHTQAKLRGAKAEALYRWQSPVALGGYGKRTENKISFNCSNSYVGRCEANAGRNVIQPEILSTFIVLIPSRISPYLCVKRDDVSASFHHISDARSKERTKTDVIQNAGRGSTALLFHSTLSALFANYLL